MTQPAAVRKEHVHEDWNPVCPRLRVKRGQSNGTRRMQTTTAKRSQYIAGGEEEDEKGKEEGEKRKRKGKRKGKRMSHHSKAAKRSKRLGCDASGSNFDMFSGGSPELSSQTPSNNVSGVC